MANIELKIVAVGDFKPVTGQLAALEAQVKAVNASMMQMGQTLSGREAAQYSSVLTDAIKASNLFRVETIKSTSAAENLGKRINTNKITMSDLSTAMRGIGKETSAYNQLAQRQIAMQDATIVKTRAGNVVIAQQGVNMQNTAIKTRVLTEELRAQNAALHQGAVNVINWGKNTQWAGRQLTYGITMPIAMLGAGMAKVFMDINSNMTRLSKVYGVSGKISKDAIASIQNDVMDLAKSLSRELGISAKDVTDIAAEFAAAGYEGTKLIEATRQASKAVILGESDKASAVKATISLQSAYQLSMTETADAMNFFNAAQAATSTTMNDLINAIPRVGPIVKQLGGTYKDTVAILTAMKEGGIPVGEAANAIKTSLARIINPTKAAQERLASFGIDIKDIVSRNAGDLTGTLQELQSQLGKLSGLPKQQALSELFGKQQFGRMTAFIENFGQGQSAKIVEMMGLSSQELATIADEQTKKIQQSASGRFKIVVESLKNSLLPVGEATLNLFTDLLERMQGFFDYLMNLPGPVKSILKLFGGLALLSGPILMFAGLFANLGGFIAKMGITVRNLFLSLSKSLNPMDTMRSKWKEYTAEMKVADTTVDKLTTSQDAGKAAMQAMTLAIEQQIQALGKLSAQSASTSSDQLRLFEQMQSLMGMQMFPMFSSTSGKRITGETRQHMIPKSDIFKQSGIGGSTVIFGTAKGDKTVERLSMAGSLFGSAIGTTEINEDILKKQAAITYGGSPESSKEIDKLKRQSIKYLEAKGLTEAQINEALRQTFITDQKMVAVEARSLAQREVMLTLSMTEKQQLAGLSNLYQEKLAKEGDAVVRQQINAEFQTRINDFFSQRVEYQSRVAAIETETLALLESELTLEGKKAVLMGLVTDSLKDEVVSYKQLATEIGLGDEQARNLVYSLRASAQAGASLELDIAALKNEFIQRVRSGYKTKAGSTVVSKSQLSAFTESSAFADLTAQQRDSIKASISLNRGKDIALLDSKGKLIGVYNLATEEISANIKVSKADALRLKAAKLSLVTEYEFARAALAQETRMNREKMMASLRSTEISRVMGMVQPGSLSKLDESRLESALGRMRVSQLRRVASQDDILGLDVGGEQLKKLRFANVRAAYRDAGGGARGMLGALKTQRGLSMGAGMGIMMGGQMLSGAMAEGATGKTTLSNASMGAGMGMMFGPQGALIGAAAGALVGIFQELGAAAERTSAGLRSTLGASKEEFTALGIAIEPITTNLPGFNDHLGDATSAVDSFRKSIQDAADTSEQKQFVEKLKGAGADQKKIDELLSNKALALATGGASKEQVGVAIKAYMQESGITTTNFNLDNLFGKDGKMLSNVPATAIANALKTVGLKGAGDFIQGTQNTTGFVPGGAGAGTSVGNFGYATATAVQGTDMGKISAIAEALKVPVEGFLNKTGDMKATLSTLQKISDLKFTNTTIGGHALNQTIADMVGDNAQLKELNSRLTSLGVEPADKLYYLSAMINGVVTNLEELAGLSTVEVKLRLDVKANQELADIAIASARSQVEEKAKGTSATETATNAVDKQIKAEQELIDAIKEVQAQRQKELDLQKKSLDYEKEKLGLQNQLRDAMASGNLLKAAELRQQIAISGTNRDAELVQNKQTEIENAAIKKHEDKIKNLEAQKEALNAVTTSTLKSDIAAKSAATSFDELKTELDGIASSPFLNATEKDDRIVAIGKKLIKLGIKKEDVAILIKQILNVGKSKVDLAREQANSARNNGDSRIPVSRLAIGGYVSGPGTATSDSILARLSNGEFVMSASAVKAYGVSTLQAMNAQKFAMGGIVGKYAMGGYVVPGGAMSYSGEAGGASINNTFYISGADPSKVADEVMKKINVTMKKTGAVVRV